MWNYSVERVSLAEAENLKEKRQMSLGNIKKSINAEIFNNPQNIKRSELEGKPFTVKSFHCITNHQGEYDSEPMDKVAVTVVVDGEERTVWFTKKCSSKATDTIVDIFFEAEASGEPLDETYKIELVKDGMFSKYIIHTA